jgi:iron complex transport system ATP-binding protein
MDKLRAEQVAFGYSKKMVLSNVSLTIRPGEVVSLLGPNGSGKTTLLKIMLGLYRPEKGAVYLDDRPVPSYSLRELARRMAYVPQSHRLSFAYRVLDMVLMGRTPHKSFFSSYTSEDEDIAVRVLERLSIIDLKDRCYTEISGGERQLTLVGRALAQGAETLVMDEPLNGLDYGNQIRLLEQIARLSREGYTFIQSTHFPDHALWFADRVVMMQNGAILADGKPEEVMSEDRLGSLYNAAIAIIRLDSGLRVCVPRSLLKKNINSPSDRATGEAVSLSGLREMTACDNRR